VRTCARTFSRDACKNGVNIHEQFPRKHVKKGVPVHTHFSETCKKVHPFKSRLSSETQKLCVRVHVQFPGTQAKKRPSCARTISRDASKMERPCEGKISRDERNKPDFSARISYMDARKHGVQVHEQFPGTDAEKGAPVHAQFLRTHAKRCVSVNAQFPRTHEKRGSLCTQNFGGDTQNGPSMCTQNFQGPKQNGAS
jgi:hypothetical protein